MSFVIDSSVLLSFLLPDEQDDRTLRLLDRMEGDGAMAPALLQYEVLSSLLVAQRRQRIASLYRMQAFATFQAMPIRYDLPADPALWHQTATLAATHGLTGYDASYLALALTRGLPLATFDRDLIAAARALSVPLM